MRPAIIFSLLLLMALPMSAQHDLGPLPDMAVSDTSAKHPNNTRISAAAAMLRSELDRMGRDVRKGDIRLIERYALQRKCGRYYVQAYVTLADGRTEQALKPYRVKTGARQGATVTALIPTRRLAALIDSGVASEIDVSFPLKIK